jgi:protein tyrosine phosphatase (PTP) superfamily phosphohydrolase (DUF442 family)
MDAPASPPRRFTRRTLLRLAGAGLALGLSAEAVRVFALSNRHTVIPGKFYRSAQLSPDELRRVIEQKKIKTVINLRGFCPADEWYLGESRTTHATNISQEDITLSAKRLPSPSEVRRLIDVLDRTEYPVIVHCQRGADRTGLVSVAAVLLLTDATLAEARRQLWPRYGHVRAGRTTVIDQFFDYYEAWLAGRPHDKQLFREWAVSHYCPGPFRAELAVVGPNPPVVPAGRGFTITIRATNRSIEPWALKPGAAGGFPLRYRLFTTSGELVYQGRAGQFAATVNPGQSIDLTAGFPPVAVPGRYLLHADLLDAQPVDILSADFVQYGSEPLTSDVFVK